MNAHTENARDEKGHHRLAPASLLVPSIFLFFQSSSPITKNELVSHVMSIVETQSKKGV
jgi:hypothetical protein